MAPKRPFRLHQIVGTGCNFVLPHRPGRVNEAQAIRGQNIHRLLNIPGQGNILLGTSRDATGAVHTPGTHGAASAVSNGPGCSGSPDAASAVLRVLSYGNTLTSWVEPTSCRIWPPVESAPPPLYASMCTLFVETFCASHGAQTSLQTAPNCRDRLQHQCLPPCAGPQNGWTRTS